jgi:YD repeat-containing protein
LNSTRQPKLNWDTIDRQGQVSFSLDHRESSNTLTRQLVFARDAQGRITAVRDPLSGSDGWPVVKYAFMTPQGGGRR